eukprot:4776510-Prymnesium_polylepis.2
MPPRRHLLLLARGPALDEGRPLAPRPNAQTAGALAAGPLRADEDRLPPGEGHPALIRTHSLRGEDHPALIRTHSLRGVGVLLDSAPA